MSSPTTKTLQFNCAGGNEKITLNVSHSSYPITYNLDNNSEWLTIDITNNVVDITVSSTYDYRDRNECVTLISSTGDELQLEINQSGYNGLGLRCDKSIVLYQSYFDMSEYYNFYVTVYGGITQELICKELKQYIVQVWDNSDMYNDFIIKIPKGLQGKYTLKHSEYNSYKEYCKENKIKFDEGKVSTTIDIVQLTTNDTTGEIIINIDGVEYKSGDNAQMLIKHGEIKSIEIVSTKYVHQLSPTKYEVVNDLMVDCSRTPNWISANSSKGIVTINALTVNTSTTRKCVLRLTNRTNAHQYIDIDIKQESGA